VLGSGGADELASRLWSIDQIADIAPVAETMAKSG